MFETCVLAVRSAIPSSSAISRFESPRATPDSTSRSRAVSVARLARALPRPRWRRGIRGPGRTGGRAARGSRAAARPGTVAQPAGDDPGDRRVEVDLAGDRGADGRGQVVGLGVLEEEPARAGLDGGRHPVLVDEAGQRDDLDLGMARLDLGGRRDPVHDRHQQVHDDDVRAQRLDRGQRLDAVLRLADHLEVVVEREEVAHAAADHRVVVGEQDPDPVAPRQGAARDDQRAAVVGERVGVGCRVAGAALEDDRRAEDRERADGLERHERFAEQPCRERDPDHRLEEHQDARRAFRRSPGSR